MKDIHKSGIYAIISAVLGALLGAWIAHGLSQQSVEYKIVDTLSGCYETISKDMSYEDAMKEMFHTTMSLENEKQKLENENRSLVSEITDLRLEMSKLQAAAHENDDSFDQALISEAKNFSQLKNYKMAISTIRRVKNATIDSEKLLVGFEVDYADQVLLEANKLEEEKRIDEAIAIIHDGLKVIPNYDILINKIDELYAILPKDLMKECPPYAGGKYDIPKSMTMGGKIHTNGFSIDTGLRGQVYINFDRKYSHLEFDVGSYDNANCRDAVFSVYLDGTFLRTIDVKATDLPQHVAIVLEDIMQLRIEADSGNSWYGFVNAVIY